MRFQRRTFDSIALGAVAGLLLACSSASTTVEGAGIRKGAAMSFALESPEWKMGEEIPSLFTCDGKDVSPPLHWDAPPAGTESISLMLEDPDAPGGTFFHWLIYDLPANTRELMANVPQRGHLSNGAHQGRNSFGKIGYGGPCPPQGPAHRYYFHIFALDRKTGLADGASRSELEQAMKGHILAQAEYMGRYKRH
jgi:Raf kinase inhibitor-like YbhB/YbcL family protein